jgi:secreted PhoX family phosphatase
MRHAGLAWRSSGLRQFPDLRDDVVRLHLPRRFNYPSFHDTTTPVLLSDGTTLPGRHDGMGAFAGPDGSVVLIRNHEINGPVPAFSAAAPVYDPMTGGSRMPWGSWVTCEETVNGPDVGPDFTTTPNIALTKPHGYVFEVPVSGAASAEPITKAGRFSHEAVSFDPREGRLYLTEDNFAFPPLLPVHPDREPGVPLHAGRDGTSTQGGGAAETGPELLNGYGNGTGQVWAYNTRKHRLTCVFQSPDNDVLDFPDNITTSNRGTLVICEDHDQDNYIRGLTQNGKLWNIALNRIPGRFADEFAGSTFSPDGETLFVNIQASQGLTFAIWGPWKSIGV